MLSCRAKPEHAVMSLDKEITLWQTRSESDVRLSQSYPDRLKQTQTQCPKIEFWLGCQREKLSIKKGEREWINASWVRSKKEGERKGHMRFHSWV